MTATFTTRSRFIGAGAAAFVLAFVANGDSVADALVDSPGIGSDNAALQAPIETSSAPVHARSPIVAYPSLSGTARAQVAQPVEENRLSGRPPLRPLQRVDPRQYDLTFRITIFTDIPPTDASARGVFDVTDAPILLPFIPRNTWSMVDLGSFNSRLWLDSREDSDAAANSRFELNKDFGMGFAIVPIQRFRGQTFRCEITYRIQSWSSRIDDVAAGNIAWPQQWPDECRDALAPQAWIDSEHAIFSEFVERVSEGRLREVPPYFAAKDLIRHSIQSFRVVNNGTVRRDAGSLVGMELSQASVAASRGTGTAHDLVAICVAVLRAAGIPARPVIGIDRDPLAASRSRFISWGEFFLPGAGWVPFDPMRIRNAAIDRRHVREAWPGIGTMDELNRRIPLAFTFHPPASVISHEWPAVYGWDPRPGRSPRNARQFINVSAVSRGAGVEDPR